MRSPLRDRDMRVMLWPRAGQCDWWVSVASLASLRQSAAGLLDLPALRRTLWSSDEDGEWLLSEARGLMPQEPRQ